MKNLNNLSTMDICFLWIQKIVSTVFFMFLWVALKIWCSQIMGYKLKNRDEAVKNIWHSLKNHKGPLIIASNHLTMVDSAIEAWILFSSLKSVFHPHLFFWNIPEKENFFKTMGFNFFMFITRCIPITRKGSASERNKTFDKIIWILDHNGTLSLFPEAGRTRNLEGKFNKTEEGDDRPQSFWTGTLIKEFPEMSVLCMYLRGKDQKKYSFMPKKGEEFFVYSRIIKPKTDEDPDDILCDAELSEQVFDTISELEQEYYNDIVKDNEIKAAA